MYESLASELGGLVRDQRYSAGGRIKESEEHNLNIYAHRKSDKAIVVRKQANKMTIRFLSTDELIAELAEQRALTDRNSGDKPRIVMQCTGQTDSGLARIHAAAKKDSQLRFNNLYRHFNAGFTDASLLESQEACGEWRRWCYLGSL